MYASCFDYPQCFWGYLVVYDHSLVFVVVVGGVY